MKRFWKTNPWKAAMMTLVSVGVIQFFLYYVLKPTPPVNIWVVIQLVSSWAITMLGLFMTNLLVLSDHPIARRLSEMVKQGGPGSYLYYSEESGTVALQIIGNAAKEKYTMTLRNGRWYVAVKKAEQIQLSTIVGKDNMGLLEVTNDNKTMGR